MRYVIIAEFGHDQTVIEKFSNRVKAEARLYQLLKDNEIARYWIEERVQ